MGERKPLPTNTTSTRPTDFDRTATFPSTTAAVTVPIDSTVVSREDLLNAAYIGYKAQIKELEAKLKGVVAEMSADLVADLPASAVRRRGRPLNHKMTQEARQRIGDAQRKRWDKWHEEKDQEVRDKVREGRGRGLQAVGSAGADADGEA